jgi:2'-hydroxyisoflavone reductase
VVHLRFVSALFGAGSSRAGITVMLVRLLVLGGTAWLGRCIVSTALMLGHEVTCLARGASGAPPEGAVFVRADRGHDVPTTR